MTKGLEGVIATQTYISSIIGTTLCYRGIGIEELAKKAEFEEVVYLLWYGKLPNHLELTTFKNKLNHYGKVPEKVIHILRDLPRDGDTMELLRTCISALPLFEEKETDIFEEAIKIQSRISTLVAAISRHKNGKVAVTPNPKYGFAKNFLYMVSGSEPLDMEVEAFNKALILHADHELNASTFSSRVTVATLSDVYSGMTSAIGTLKGPLHGGANEQVMKMLSEIGSIENVESYINEKILNKDKIMGIGHRVYRNGDPRAFILKEMSKNIAEAVGKSHWYDISVAIEEKIQREKGLKPNVDFYSATLYSCLGFSGDIFTPIFAVSRTSGWLAHMMEQYQDNRLIRPRAEYVGPIEQKYIPIEERE